MGIKKIIPELKGHLPFTALGAVSGILIVLVFRKLPENIAFEIFYILHPLHVYLSALVTAAIFKLHKCEHFGKKCVSGRCNFLSLLVIGYAGSIGIATLSDCIIPYIGEMILNLPNRHIHLGFIEKWWLVNPLAFLGVLTAYLWPKTKFPHAGHVLLSTWASTFHIILAMTVQLSLYSYILIFTFLLIAVWVPCCLSDIIFPMLFVQDKN
ncbi:MAG: hypothetical protein K9M56_05280 [Victivallales bacterium]|nr:hypothetical protein [Victivallales bacterium]